MGSRLVTWVWIGVGFLMKFWEEWGNIEYCGGLWEVWGLWQNFGGCERAWKNIGG